MSIGYRLRKSIKADELFDGRLEAFGVREEVRPEGAADRFPPYMKVREVRYLTDGRNSMEVVVYENGVPDLTVSNLWCAPEKKIFHAIAEAFDTDIVTEDQPKFWGFDTQEEWDAYQNQIHEENERKFHAELLKHLRGEGLETALALMAKGSARNNWRVVCSRGADRFVMAQGFPKKARAQAWARKLNAQRSFPLPVVREEAEGPPAIDALSPQPF